MAVKTVSDDVDDLGIIISHCTAFITQAPKHRRPPFFARAAMLVWSQMLPSLAPLELDIMMWQTAEAVKVAYQEYVKSMLNIDLLRTDYQCKRGPLVWRSTEQLGGVFAQAPGWNTGIEIMFHKRIDTRTVYLNTVDESPALDSVPDASIAVSTAIDCT